MDTFDQSLANPREESLIARLRTELGDAVLQQASPEASSDIGLLRFLRGHGHEVSAAATAFKAGVEWRLKNNALRWRKPLLLSTAPEEATVEEINAHYTDLRRLPHWDKVGLAYPERFYHGHDKQGNPVMITTHDMIENALGLMALVTREHYDEYRVARAVLLELYLDALSRKMKRLVKCVYIWDLNGMTRSLWRTWENKSVKAYWGDWDHQSSIAFPEHAYRIIGVNVPSWLMVIYKMARSLIPKNTLRKVVVIGTSGVADALLKQAEIPAASLPKFLGGICTVDYFIRPNSSQEIHKGTLDIPAGTSKSLEFNWVPGVLRWAILVHGSKDIIVQEESVVEDEKNSFVSKIHKVDEFGSGVLDFSHKLSGGKFWLKCDNHSNMFFSKSIDYVFFLFPEVYHDTRQSM